MKTIALLAVVGFASSAALAQNTGFRLTDGDSLYDITSAGATGTIPTTTQPTGTAAGAQGNFRVTGGPATTGVDNVYAMWWWYRVNGVNTRENGVRQAAGTAVRTSTAANTVTYTITEGTLQFDTTYTLTDQGGNGGTIGAANIFSSLRITNLGTAAIDVSLFNYLDIFLGGQDGNDRLVSRNNVNGWETNWDDSVLTNFRAQYTGFGATSNGTGTFSAVGGQIADTSIDNFNFNNYTTPQDYATIMQWDLGLLAAGASFQVGAALSVSNDASIAPSAIPTPGAAALLGLGGLAAFRRRRA